MDTILLTGLFAAFFTTFAFAPQSIKTIRTRNTEGISVVMYIMFLTGVISWIAYGIMRSDFAVLIANIVTLFLAAPVLVITLINRRKKHVLILQSSARVLPASFLPVMRLKQVTPWFCLRRIPELGGSGTPGVVALTVMPVCRTLVIHFIILAFPLAISMNEVGCKCQIVCAC